MSENKIPGVDMEAGLELFCGEMDMFVDALKSFAANTLAAANRLRNVTKEGLPDYAITAHGLKSISGTIAAQKIVEKAKKLEALAKAGDLAGVLAENDTFIKDIETLVSNIKSWLKAAGHIQ